MMTNICLMPSCTSPTSVPTAGRSPPKVSSQVVDAFSPILCSTLVAYTPLRSPSSPSGDTRYLGTRNIDRPLVPGPAPAGRASTRWKMFSAMSCSALVMKRLTPSMCQVPSGWAIALVRPAPTSEPASGSVSAMVAVHLRSIASAANRLCSGVPRRHSACAIEAPLAYIQTAGLAPRISSATAQCSDRGASVPPSSAGSSSRNHSASTNAWKDFLNASGMRTDEVAGSNTGGLRSASAKESAMGPVASRLTSSRIPRAVSSSISGKRSEPSTSCRPSISNRLNSMSLRLLL